MRRTLGVLALGVALALPACSRAPSPPEIRLGQDRCDRCDMVISEGKFAAAYLTEAGEARRFDDIGCLLAYLAEKGERAKAYWVHDYETGEWMTAEEAWYVSGTRVPTPMGYGILAFGRRERAETFASEHGGEVQSFEELKARGAPMRPGPGASPHGMGH